MAKKKIKPLVGITAQGIGFRLSSHERLCAERMKQLLSSINELNKKVSKLTTEMAQGQGAVKVLMALGAIVVGILGYLNIK